MENWYNAIEQRFSVRRYKSGISAQEMASLQKFANETLNAHGIRIALGRSSNIFSSKLFQRKITGTECFAAIISKTGKDIYSGYIGEIFILECVSRGYGTCWIGSSFKMSAALETIELDEGESIVCVTPIGISDEEQPYRKRLSITELTDLTKDEFLNLPKWQQCAIESARLAPSAMNRQPWQFYVYDDSFGIVNVSRNLGYGHVDCGIAMIHAELGAAHCGVTTEWDMNTKSDEALLRPIIHTAHRADDDEAYTQEDDSNSESTQETYDSDKDFPELNDDFEFDDFEFDDEDMDFEGSDD